MRTQNSRDESDMSQGRIDLLSIDTARRIGGGQIAIETTLRSLDRNRFRVTLACPQASALADRLRDSDIEILPWVPPSRALRGEQPDLLGSGASRAALVPFASVAALIRLVGWARRRKHLVIHGNTFQGAVLGACLAALVRRPFIFHDRNNKAHGAIERWVCRRADVVLAVSRATSRKWGSLFERKTRILYDGVDLDRFHCRGDRSERDRLGIAQDAPVLLAVSRISPEKALDLLVEAVAMLRPETRLLIAGEPFLPEDREYQKRIALLATMRGVRLSFLGFVQDMTPVFEAADIFVLSSSDEAFGLVILEAMAMGRPVIVPRKAGALDIVDEGRTGLFFEPGNARDLAEKIQSLVERPDEMARLGAEARRVLKERFAPQETVARFARTIEELALGSVSDQGFFAQSTSE